ncbi:MAG: NAD(+) synthase [Oscillospiraceae bacterium]|nr:NAD(+) synthase [Oscillospiraceae bacterium]
MRDYEREVKYRIDFIKKMLDNSGASGIVFGNSGGKDAALTGILCKLACDDTLGLLLPCGSNQNYGSDMDDAHAVADQFGIKTSAVDLKSVFETMKLALGNSTALNDAAVTNIAPRLRMTALYAVAASEGRLVAGTGNRSERHMGYFTKWGDGAYDFNPIADLTVSEIYAFLEYLGAPRRIIEKAPSAGLFDGQTDEADMGVTYKCIDEFLLTGTCPEEEMSVITKYHTVSAHKRKMPPVYGA